MNNHPSHRYGRSIVMPIPPSLDIKDPSLWPHWTLGQSWESCLQKGWAISGPSITPHRNGTPEHGMFLPAHGLQGMTPQIPPLWIVQRRSATVMKIGFMADAWTVIAHGSSGDRYQCYQRQIWVSCWFNVLDIRMWWSKMGVGIGRSRFEGWANLVFILNLYVCTTSHTSLPLHLK